MLRTFQRDAQPFANVEIGKTPNYLLMRKVCDEYNIFVTRIPFVNQMVCAQLFVL